MNQPMREVFTPEQVAEYLQINRETVYRYIRSGKLVAFRLGRTYRVPKRSVELLLWATRTREDVTLREYTGAEIADFVERDQLDEEAQAIAGRSTGRVTGVTPAESVAPGANARLAPRALDHIGAALQEQGISLDELIASGRKERGKIIKELYDLPEE